jgi:hypothetical protein
MANKLSDNPKTHKRLLELIRASKKARPKASDAWHLTNSVFRAQNESTKRGR